MNLYPKLIREALTHVRYPGTQQDVVSAGLVQDDLRIEGNKVSFSLLLRPGDPLTKSLVKACEQAILTYISPDIDIKGNIRIQHPTPETPAEKPLTGAYKLAIASGKGGVGKSTVAANLAIALGKMGYKVGLLDADIYGPSLPKMFGVEDARPVADEQGNILPVEKFGIKLLSIGFFVQPTSAIVWRGAMASNAIKQLLQDAAWGELDYFLIDLPPGTGDIHLTLVQTLDLDGAIVVSTPQQVALADAIKGIDLFENEKIHVPVVGLIENMAWFTPAEHPTEKYYLFGKEGVKQLAEERGLRLLGQIPLVQGLCTSGDAGEPFSLHGNGIVAEAFENAAKSITFTRS